MAKRDTTYIDVINRFWEVNDREPMEATTIAMFFYILNRINRARWQPVAIPWAQLVSDLKISKKSIKPIMEILKNKKLLEYKIRLKSRNSATLFNIPNMAEEVSQGTTGGSPGNHLPPPPPILSIEDIEDTSATKRASAQGDGAVADPQEKNFSKAPRPNQPPKLTTGQNDVWPEAPVIADEKNSIQKGREISKKQNELLFRFFFDPSQRRTIEAACMKLAVTPQQYRTLADEVRADWEADGTTHTDYRDAARHLRLTIPKKAAAQRRDRQQEADNFGHETEQEARQRLMTHCMTATAQFLATQQPDDAQDDPNRIPAWQIKT